MVDNSKIVEAKIGVKTAKSKSKSKDKNSLKLFLVKSQAFAQSSRSDFLISKAR